MKIIKPGIQPEKRILAGKCGQCECEVECEQSEATLSWDRNEHYWTVPCPTCTGQSIGYVRFIYLSEKK